MAEHGGKLHDGRFGERFDAEISVKGLVQITVGLAVTCLVALVITWVMLRPERASVGSVDAPVPAEALPPGPRLQAHPEAEYRAMRREQDALLNGYGWVDEAAGVVHVPIDVAIDRLLERGLEAWPAPAPEGEMGDGTQQEVAR